MKIFELSDKIGTSPILNDFVVRVTDENGNKNDFQVDKTDIKSDSKEQKTYIDLKI